MHLAHDLLHAVERLGRRLDQHVNALVEGIDLAVGDYARDLYECVAGEIKPGHLAVDPDEPVSHSPSLGDRPWLNRLRHFAAATRAAATRAAATRAAATRASASGAGCRAPRPAS